RPYTGIKSEARPGPHRRVHGFYPPATNRRYPSDLTRDTNLVLLYAVKQGAETSGGRRRCLPGAAKRSDETTIVEERERRRATPATPHSTESSAASRQVV